jgi:hypothetical protein
MKHRRLLPSRAPETASRRGRLLSFGFRDKAAEPDRVPAGSVPAQTIRIY